MIKITLECQNALHVAAVLDSYEGWLCAEDTAKARREKALTLEFVKSHNERTAAAATAARNEPAPGVYRAGQWTAEEQAEMAAKNTEPLDFHERVQAKRAAAEPKAEAPKEEPSSSKPDESAAPGVTYDDLKASIMKLVAKSPAEMKKVCEAFGLKTFAGTTDPELWAKAKAMIDAKVVS